MAGLCSAIFKGNWRPIWPSGGMLGTVVKKWDTSQGLLNASLKACNPWRQSLRLARVTANEK